MNIPLQRMLESKRFVETVYFGTLQLNEKNSAETHLFLGLACCGTIKPIAKLQRFMSDPEKMKDKSIDLDGLIVTRDTTMVYEGLFHLVEAKRINATVYFPESLHQVVKEVVQDLEDYLTQEFHGFRSEYREYDLRTAGIAALILLKKLINDETEIDSRISRLLDSGVELLNELEQNESGDAAFYTIITK